MNATLIMAGVTFREAARRKILWAALIAAGLLLSLFGFALHLQMRNFQSRSMSPFLRYQIESGILTFGLYICAMLAVVMTVLTSMDTLSGEIGSGTIQAVATKPISRWQIIAGKLLGFIGMIVAFVALTFTGAIALTYTITGVLPEHPVRGALLVCLECLVALSLTLMAGTRLATLTNGALVIGLHGLAFIGGWLEQASNLSQSAGMMKLAITASLIMPTEVLWRRAAYELQSPLAGSLMFSPFSNVSIPSGIALGYSGVYIAVMIGAAAWLFHRRDL